MSVAPLWSKVNESKHQGRDGQEAETSEAYIRHGALLLGVKEAIGQGVMSDGAQEQGEGELLCDG